LARVARRQHGAVTRAQLLALGFARHAIDGCLGGRLIRAHRRVYILTPILAPLAHEWAAYLSCGPDAFVSHLPAARILGLVEPARGSVPEITVVGRDPGRRRGVRIHRTSRLDADERTAHGGLPMTNAARTILDLAGRLRPRELEQMLAIAERRRLAPPAHVRKLVDRYPVKAGTRALRALLDHRPALARSEAERRLLTLIRAADLPLPESNVRVGRFEVDLLWRAYRVIVEVDGYGYHGDRAAFEADRRRDGALAAMGFTVIRVTWRQIVDRREAAIARIAQSLAVRSPA
jgi:very-short-patch-repair endonuclease